MCLYYSPLGKETTVHGDIVSCGGDDVVSCGGDWLVLYCMEVLSGWGFLSQCICLFSCSHNAHTQLLLLATVLVFHSLTAFVSSLPQVQTSHAALGHLCNTQRNTII